MARQPQPRRPGLDQRHPRPEPHFPALIPDPEDFAAWCAHPVTRFVATAYQVAGEAQKTTWDKEAWEGAKADPLRLAELRARADAYRAFLETSLEAYVSMLETA